jgi:hypothetical protein
MVSRAVRAVVVAIILELAVQALQAKDMQVEMLETQAHLTVQAVVVVRVV